MKQVFKKVKNTLLHTESKPIYAYKTDYIVMRMTPLIEKSPRKNSIWR